MKPKQNAKTNKAKKPETKVLNYDFESGRWEWTDEKSMQDDLASAPLGKNHAANRRYKKSKQRAKVCYVSNLRTFTMTRR